MNSTNINTKAADRRTVKTKKAIYNATARLIREKKLENITVTELAKEADVNRKTFYAYYGSPVDVVNECLEDLSASLWEIMNGLPEDYNVLSPNVMFSLLSPLISDNPVIYEMTLSVNGDQLYKRLIEMLKSVIIHKMNISSAYSSLPAIHREIIAGFISSGMVNVYYNWVSKKDLSFEEVTEILSKLILSGISYIGQK